MVRQERCQHARQVLAGRCRVGQKPNRARHAPRIASQIAPHALHLLHDQSRVLQKALTRGRQGYAAAISNEQRHAEHAFHASDALTRGRQRKVGLSRAMRDAASFRNA
jgi:hypothetical protein